MVALSYGVARQVLQHPRDAALMLELAEYAERLTIRLGGAGVIPLAARQVSQIPQHAGEFPSIADLPKLLEAFLEIGSLSTEPRP